MPTVSVIVPNYNHAAFLPKRMESILNQTYRDFEIILLDDNSVDDSVSLLSGYCSHPQVSHIICNEENSGSPFKQWKKGITLASGKYIWIAESDDYADPSFLEVLVTVLDNAPAVGVAYSQSQIINEKGDVLFTNTRWTDNLSTEVWKNPFQINGVQAIRDFFIYKTIIPNASAVVFRKEVVDRISDRLEKFRYAGDWLVWIEMLFTCELYYTPLLLNYFRLHAAVTRNRKTFAQRIEYFMEAYCIVGFIDRKIDLSQEERQKAYDYLAKKVYRKFGFRYLFSWKGYRLSKKISSFDPYFAKRVFAITWSRLRNKMQLLCY